MILIQTSLVVRCNTTMTRLANACTRFRVANLQARHEGEGKALRQDLTAGIESRLLNAWHRPSWHVRRMPCVPGLHTVSWRDC